MDDIDGGWLSARNVSASHIGFATTAKKMTGKDDKLCEPHDISNASHRTDSTANNSAVVQMATSTADYAVENANPCYSAKRTAFKTPQPSSVHLTSSTTYSSLSQIASNAAHPSAEFTPPLHLLQKFNVDKPATDPDNVKPESSENTAKRTLKSDELEKLVANAVKGAVKTALDDLKSSILMEISALMTVQKTWFEEVLSLQNCSNQTREDRESPNRAVKAMDDSKADTKGHDIAYSGRSTSDKEDSDHKAKVKEKPFPSPASRKQIPVHNAKEKEENAGLMEANSAPLDSSDSECGWMTAGNGPAQPHTVRKRRKKPAPFILDTPNISNASRRSNKRSKRLSKRIKREDSPLSPRWAAAAQRISLADIRREQEEAAAKIFARMPEGSTRTKDVRQRMIGYEWAGCKEFYDAMELTDEERRKRVQQVSRQRGFKERPPTPPGYFNIYYPSIEEQKALGLPVSEKPVQYQTVGPALLDVETNKQ